jgi:hypothetical protein
VPAPIDAVRLMQWMGCGAARGRPRNQIAPRDIAITGIYVGGGNVASTMLDGHAAGTRTPWRRSPSISSSESSFWVRRRLVSFLIPRGRPSRAFQGCEGTITEVPATTANTSCEWCLHGEPRSYQGRRAVAPALRPESRSVHQRKGGRIADGD